MKEDQPKSLTSKIKDVAKKLHESEGGMLILTRKVDQGIFISGNIVVRVLGIERDRVKIGISAPAEIKVMRQELLGADADTTPFQKRQLGAEQPSEVIAHLPIPGADTAPQG